MKALPSALAVSVSFFTIPSHHLFPFPGINSGSDDSSICDLMAVIAFCSDYK